MSPSPHPSSSPSLVSSQSSLLILSSLRTSLNSFQISTALAQPLSVYSSDSTESDASPSFHPFLLASSVRAHLRRIWSTVCSSIESAWCITYFRRKEICIVPGRVKIERHEFLDSGDCCGRGKRATTTITIREVVWMGEIWSDANRDSKRRREEKQIYK